MKRDASQGHRDVGAALLLAIVVVTGISVALAAALGFAATSVRSSAESYRPARTSLYAADAAAKIASRYLVDHPEFGTWNGGTCRTLDVGTLDGAALSAEICPQAESSFELIRDAQTDWAVMTFPQPGDQDGIRLNSSAVVGFSGSVSSTGRINAGGAGTIAISNGSALSPEACRGTVTVDGTTIDNATCVATALTDPAYAIADPNVPAAAGGSCDAVTDIATLTPGSVTSALWTSTTGDCDHVVMSPGVYHFKDVAWSIDKKVIAGKPATTPVTTALFSESLLGCDPDAQGVQIVLSGSSTISLASGGSLHVCGRAKDSNNDGTPDVGALQIAIHGPTTDQTGTSRTLTPTDAAAASGTWTTVANAKVVDATGATDALKYADTTHLASVTLPVRVSSSVPSTTAVRLTGFGDTGTTYSSTNASIALTSGLSALANVSIDAAIASASGGGTCTASGLAPTAAAELKTISVSLTCSGALTAPLTATITASNRQNGTRTWRVDGATITFASPGIAKHDPPSNKNTLDQGGSGRHFWFTDIVYAPLATANLQTPNTATYTSFDGLVLRTLTVNGTGGANQKPIVGDPGYRRDGDVVITVSVADTPWVSGRWFYETADSRTAPPVPTTQTWVVHR